MEHHQLLTLAHNVVQSDHHNLELPFYTKYLLIAGYLASHNEAKTDKRFFVKHHGKERKTMKSLKAKQKVNALS